MTLLPFAGKQNDNVQNWIGLAEDTFTASHVNLDNWAYMIAQAFHKPALTWYYSQKQANNNRAPAWNVLKQAMLDHWNNPARMNELQMRLNGIVCKGSISDFCTRFQEIAVQIPDNEMAPSDRQYIFCTKISQVSKELAMQLLAKPKDMATLYIEVRRWEGLQKLTNATSVMGNLKSFKKLRPCYGPPSAYSSAMTMPHLPPAPSTSSAEPMDLDAMNMSQDPRNPPVTVRCYNCNELGHFAQECPKPEQCGPARLCPKPSKSMHLFEVAEEEEEEEGVELSYPSEEQEDEYTPEGYNPDDECKPDKPDLGLQYLVNKANLMEERRNLQIALKKDCSHEDSPDIIQIYSDDEEYAEWHICNNWHPQSPDEDYLNLLCTITPVPTPIPGTAENPIELYNIAHPDLPLYELEIGPPKLPRTNPTVTFLPVRAIMDTGAASNYVASSKAWHAGAQVVPISTREIIGAGSTVTTAFAVFTLKIGGMRTKCYAYMLDDERQFCYDLLLGCSWLRRHNATPCWDDDAYELTHPEDKTKFYVKPILAKERTGITKLLTNWPGAFIQNKLDLLAFNCFIARRMREWCVMEFRLSQRNVQRIQPLVRGWRK